MTHRLSVRRLTLGAGVVLALGLGTVAAAVPAQAASTGRAVSPRTYGEFTDYVTTNGVNIRSGPGTGYSSNGQAQTGQALYDYCYTTGTSVGGNPFWDYVYDTATGVSGYVTEYYLTDQSQTEHC
jgi:uncharacterized protein YraI